MKLKSTLLIICIAAMNFSFASMIVPAKDSSVNVVVTDSLTTVNETTLKNALNEFKSLSHKEKMFRIKEAKLALKNYKAAKANNDEVSTNTILLVILAIILPPLAVLLHENALNGKFWLSLLLTLLFWIPGVIYALIVILA